MCCYRTRSFVLISFKLLFMASFFVAFPYPGVHAVCARGLHNPTPTQWKLSIRKGGHIMYEMLRQISPPGLGK